MAVEGAVSAHYGLAWTVRQANDLADLASHPAAILSDGTHAVFAKLNTAAHARDQFETELAALRLLGERAGVLAPVPIGVVPLAGGAILILEAASPVSATAQTWRDIGRALARIHRVKGQQCGLEMQCYFGPLFQDNRPLGDWPSFFVERRLWPRLAGAINSGHLPTETIRQVERLIVRLPRLDIPEVAPSLLHGDAQRNNFISTRAGALVIDPAPYYGHPEVDLAHVDYFEPVPDDVFAGYRETQPIHAGFAERRALWRIPTHLALIEVAGAHYLEPLTQALRQYA
jgi:protein-ribulosamine 3-kinase